MMNIRIDVDIDDQAPASPRISAYRRCKELNPRWRDDLPSGSPNLSWRHRSEHQPLDRSTQRPSAPSLH